MTGVVAGFLIGLVALVLVTVVGLPGDDVQTNTSETAATDQALHQPTAGTGTELIGPSGPFVEATLRDGELTLTGLVPNPETAAALRQTAEQAYPSTVQSDLRVDTELEPITWLDSAPAIVALLALIDDGTIRIIDGGVSVVGTAPSSEAADQFQLELVNTAGLPVTIDNLSVSELAAAVVTLQADGGQVLIAGRVPDESVRDLLQASADASYGPENVVVNVTVDPTVTSALWMASADELLSALAAFPDYRVTLDGPAFTGFVGGGTQFAPASSAVPIDDPVLNFMIDTMGRDPNLMLLIEGHTDTDGDETFNLELSQRRADAVASYLTERGVSPERISAVGKGEIFPIAPNDSADGKGRNRRVELTLSSDEEG